MTPIQMNNIKGSAPQKILIDGLKIQINGGDSYSIASYVFTRFYFVATLF
jgi:hypothetical protein